MVTVTTRSHHACHTFVVSLVGIPTEKRVQPAVRCLSLVHLFGQDAYLVLLQLVLYPFLLAKLTVAGGDGGVHCFDAVRAVCMDGSVDIQACFFLPT